MTESRWVAVQYTPPLEDGAAITWSAEDDAWIPVVPTPPSGAAPLPFNANLQLSSIPLLASTGWLAPGAFQVGATSVPLPVAPGGQITESGGIHYTIPAGFTGTLTVESFFIMVASSDGTEVLGVSSTEAPYEISTSGIISDFDLAIVTIGADLSNDGSGDITTEAGGTFTVQFRVTLEYAA